VLKISPPKVEKSTYGTVPSRQAARNICPRTKIHIFSYRGLPWESSRRADVTSAHLTCNAATCRFRGNRSQNLGFSDPCGTFQRGEDLSGTDIYYRAKFHADRCHRRRESVPGHIKRYTYKERIIADLISDKTNSGVRFAG